MKKAVRNLLFSLIVLFLIYSALIAPAFYRDTCWNGMDALQEYLDHQYGRDRKVTILKTAQEDRAMGVIYQWEEEMYIAFFDKLLFGLRWKYTGMDMIDPEGYLSSSGHWKRTGNGSKCVVGVYGDNRGGLVGSYEMKYHEEISRQNLETDFILDIYVLDGIDELPREPLIQYAPDGQISNKSK